MGASDILNNGGVDLSNSRLERSTRTNQPDFAPGQGLDDLFSNNLSTPSVQPNTLDFGGAFTPVGLNPLGLGQPQQSPQVVKSEEDKIFEAVGAVLKAVFSGLKHIFVSFGKTTPKFWAQWGSLCVRVSAVDSIVGLVLMFLIKDNTFGFNLMLGSLISIAVSVVVLMFNYENARGYVDKVEEPEPELVVSQPVQDFASDLDFSDTEDYDYEDDFTSDFFTESASVEPKAGLDFETALDTMVDIPSGMYTRQYLYETFSKVLDTIKPDYDTVRTFDEDSDTFIAWEQWLRDSAEIVGTKFEDLPELWTLEETSLTIRLVCSRPKNFKSDAVAIELANIYANVDGTTNPNVYAICSNVGKECRFTVFTGKSLMVSLKDMYQKCESFILSTKNYLPIVIGVNQEGKAVYADFKKIESILVTGMPRKGKSWVVQLLLTQMCALLSPRELNIYICDPKDDISDFKAFTLPHVKKFVSGDDNIVNTLRKVIKEEAPRRKKLIGKAGFVNIWDYKEEYPDVDLPIIYILIDEVVTLAERMDKDTKSEFQGYLVELISQLPALGIRAFLVPHVVKNNIISKTATDLIPCRISVCGDASHIEACTGTKPKDFNFKLSNLGDMAVRIPDISPSTLFVHGGVLSSSNTRNSKIFDYLRRTWLKLEPDCVANPIHILARNDKELEDLCESFEVDKEKMLGFDDLNLF